MEIHQKTSVPNNQKLKTMVKRCTDQKILLRSFDARHWRIESGAVVRRRKGIIGVWRRKRSLTSGKKETSVRKEDRCSVRHDTQDRAQKPDTFHEIEACRGREVSEANVSMGSILRQPGRYYLKGTCTRTSCEYWHPPECQFFFFKKKKKRVCKAGDKCLFPHYKVDEQPNKKAEEGATSKKKETGKTRMLCLFVKSVSQLGCVSQDSDALESQGTKESRRNPMQKVFEPTQRVRFTKSTLQSSEYPGKERTIVGKNKCQSSSSAESPTF